MGGARTSRVGWIGERFLERWRRDRFYAAAAAAILAQAARPRNWPATTRAVFARQMLFTAFDAIRFVAFLALLVGVSVVLQAHVWLGRVGQSALFGPLLVAVLVREAGPLLVNFVLVGRTGTAIAAELSTLRAVGEIDVLERQGMDPFLYLVVPRGLATALSAFCLTVLFLVIAFLGGYVAGALLGFPVGTPLEFTQSVFGALRPADIASLAAKTFVPGLVTGTICAVEGLRVRGAVTEVPQAVSRSVTRSVGALFLVSVAVSLLSYL
jgi:phospholipid/cholesterol/gamma-HCH transport system permease protein